MKKKLLGVLLTAVVTTSLLAGCGSSEEPAAPAAQEEPENVEEAEEETEAAGEVAEPEEATEEAATSEGIDTSENYLEGKKIVVLLKSYTHMFWVEAANEAEMLADQYGCEVEILAPTVANSNEEQIELLENSLVSPPDLYIIVPAEIGRASCRERV